MTTDTIGSASYATTETANYQRYYPLTASASGTLTTVGVNIGTPSGNIRVGIYTTYNAGTGIFSGLLGQSASTAAAAGWNDLSVGGGISIVQGNTYYLVVEPSDGTTNTFEAVASGTFYYYTSGSYAAFTDPSGASTIGSGETVNMRIIYSSSSTTKKYFGDGLTWFKTP